MKILGIDPGSARMGWGLIVKEGSGLRVEGYGCLETSKDDSIADRLAALSSELTVLVQRLEPDVAAVESLFFFKNQTTAMRVAEARGVALATLAGAGLEVYEYTPLQVKQSLAGYGRAEKHQVELMVGQALGITEKIRPDDAADALAVAVTHAARERLERLSGAAA
jgi:crossover junction endodeoxyribonuclease RuvC